MRTYLSQPSIRAKLITASLLTITFAFAVSAIVVGLTLSAMSESFLALHQERSDTQVMAMKRASAEAKEKVRRQLLESLELKGNAMLEKDALLLRPAFLENSYTGIRGFIERVFEFDHEILQATFFTARDGEIRAWHHLSRQSPKGLALSNRYDASIDAWTYEEGGTTVTVQDSGVTTAAQRGAKSVEVVDFLLIDAAGTRRIVKAFDCVIPIFDEDSGSIATVKSLGEAIGYLRYVISLEHMAAALAAEEQRLSDSLQRQEDTNRQAALDTASVARATAARSQGILAVVAALILLLAAAVAAWTSTRLARPIRELTASAETIARGDYTRPVDITSTDELGMLARAFDTMRLRVKAFTEDLQGLVDERTRALADALAAVTEEKRKIQEILDHIDQGIMTFRSGLAIEPALSRFLLRFFDKPLDQIVGQDVVRLVFDNSELSRDDLAAIAAALEASIGDDVLSWEINSGHLPSEASIRVGDEPRIIALSWNPIIGDDGAVQSLMLSLRDMTRQRALEGEVAAERSRRERMMSLIGELVQAKRDMARVFLTEATTRMASLERALEADYLDVPQLRRELHTLKGGARTLGLKSLALAAHTAEDAFEGRRIEATQHAAAVASLGATSALVSEYRRILHDVLGGGFESPALAAAEPVTLIDIALRQLEPLKKQLFAVDLQVEAISCIDQVIAWRKERMPELADIIMHALTNAADHGYVLPAQRGLPKRNARFTITAALADDHVELRIADTGYGVDAVKARHLAAAKGFVPSPGGTLLDVFFEDGISTASQPTLTSGRGVGLGAIRRIAESLGGDASLKGNDPCGTVLIIRLAVDEMCVNQRPSRRSDGPTAA